MSLTVTRIASKSPCAVALMMLGVGFCSSALTLGLSWFGTSVDSVIAQAVALTESAAATRIPWIAFIADSLKAEVEGEPEGAARRICRELARPGNVVCVLRTAVVVGDLR